MKIITYEFPAGTGCVMAIWDARQQRLCAQSGHDLKLWNVCDNWHVSTTNGIFESERIEFTLPADPQ